jgi:hypothetical protein
VTTPHTDLATAEAVRTKLLEARLLAGNYPKEELRAHLDALIEYVEAEIRALQDILGPHEDTQGQQL